MYSLTLKTKNGHTVKGAEGALPLGDNPLSHPFILFAYTVLLLVASVVLLQYPIEVYVVLYTALVALGAVIGIIPVNTGWIIWIGGIVLIAILKRNIISEG